MQIRIPRTLLFSFSPRKTATATTITNSIVRHTRPRPFAQVHDVFLEVQSPAPPHKNNNDNNFGLRTDEVEDQDEQYRQQLERERELSEYKTMERNVLNRPLQLHSTRPLTGYLRTGYCESPPATDAGNHSVAAELSDSFLDFSAARGNDLRAAGVTAGCRWCLCVARWKEAFDAAMRGEAGGVEGGVVPRVWLERTNVRALEGVRLEDLRRFAVDGDAVAGGEGGGGGGGKKGEGK